MTKLGELKVAYDAAARAVCFSAADAWSSWDARDAAAYYAASSVYIAARDAYEAELEKLEENSND
jgi:hypothetical protein